MPVLPYLRRATIQPTYPVLNRRHPIAKDIAFFCTQRGGKFVDLVTGAVGTFNGAGKQPLARGQARPAATIQANLTSAGSDYYEFPHNPAWNLIGDISLLWSGVIATGSAFRHFAGKHAAGGGADNPFDFRTDSGAAPRAALVRANAGGATINSSAFNAMALGVYNHAGVTCNAANNGSHNYYNNGGPAEVTSAVSGNAATSNTQTLRVGRRADGAVQMNGTTEAVIGWARIVGGGEFTSLWRNIWQLTEPTELWSIFFDDGAAAQVAYPIADIATNGWLPSSGTDLFPMLDETTRDDSDYVYSPANPTTQYFEELLTSLLVPIAGAQGIKYTLRAQGQATHFVVDVRQGSTSLHVFTHDLTVAQGWQEFTQTITAVTNYADARVRITASAP